MTLKTRKGKAEERQIRRKQLYNSLIENFAMKL